jgi:uncharacterized protein involved in cysteine biosynthesis
VAQHGLWLYVLAPVVLNLALIGTTVSLGVHYARQSFANHALGSPLAAIGMWVLGALFGLLFFVILQPVVGAPFVDVLTEKTESIVRGGHPRVGVLLAAWRSLGHGMLKLLCYVVALALVIGLTTLTGIGGGITAALSAVLLAYDGFDFPLARRGAGFGAKWKYLLVHPGQTLGYCVGATLLYFVPLAIVVAPAFAAVGATLAFLDTDGDTDLGIAARRGSVAHATDGGASIR